jgi:type IV pilus assembly protein PilA
MNNKGVTLVELLIVIVVLGIISAFAIPAVGTIVENAEKSSVYNDALMVENAAKLYCQDNSSDTTCDSGTLTFTEFGPYIDGLVAADYANTLTATTSDGSTWVVELIDAEDELGWFTCTVAPSSDTCDKGDVTAAAAGDLN